MEPLIQTKNGFVRGTTRLDYDKERFYCFYGIPYGKNPVGDLRFKPPVAIENWDGIKDCSVAKEGCLSRHMFTAQFYGTEDCLYVNVYTKNLNPNAKTPVFVWIHGGAFVTGSGNPDIFGPDFLMTQNIVMVTITYRLGPLGFLCLEDDSLGVPGNAGVKDALMGLRWVNENVRRFGGDPSNVTMGGQSSGAIIANFIMLSPLGKGLFNKVIMQSATALQNWAIGRREGAIQLAEKLGFKSNCEKEVLEFLKGVDGEKLVRASQKVRILTDDRFADYVHIFNPVIEKPNPGAVILESPLLTIMRGDYNKVPLLMGYTSEEGLYGTFIVKQFKVIIEDFEKMVPHTLKLPKGSEKSKMVAKKIKDFYFGSKPCTQENKYDFLRLTSAVFFSHSVYRAAKHYVKNQNHNLPIYFYRFSVESDLNLYKLLRKYNAPGASHTDDTCYLFSTMLTPEIKAGSVEDLSIRRMTKLWGNFIRNGNPIPPEKDSLININWKPIGKDVMNFVDITNEGLFEKENPDEEIMKLWDDIYRLDPLYSSHKL